MLDNLKSLVVIVELGRCEVDVAVCSELDCSSLQVVCGGESKLSHYFSAIANLSGVWVWE